MSDNLLPIPEPPRAAAPARKRYVPAVGPRLRRLLLVVLGGFALLAVNSFYMSSITFVQWRNPDLFAENNFYHWNFLLHLALGIAFTLPVILFGILHIRNAYNRPNRRAVMAGYALFSTALLLLVTGFLLMRIDGFIQVKDSASRDVIYWAHVITPLVAGWLFVLHRLAGKRIRWRAGLGFAGFAGAIAAAMVFFHFQDARQWNVAGPKEGAEKYFFPSLARTDTGNFIPAETLMAEGYCIQCHADIHESWSHSVHRFSSFNNPAYLFSVKGTRKAMMERDGNVRGSRFCAGCHDPVPFFSGAFDDPKFDDPDYDLAGDSLAQAGITCTTCHAITHVNSPPIGNSDYTIAEPVHYPFAFSDNPFLQWVNNQLIKAKPGLHKRTFLKDFHKTPDFCGTCHKVHLPPELNDYKWLRGQNHFDTYHLSGVSGHGIAAWYYPKKASPNCTEGCHMPLLDSTDFGARDFDGDGNLEVHSHQFPSANTAIAHILKLPDWVIENHRKFNEGVMRVDVFGLREGGDVGGRLLAPIRPDVPELAPGRTYLLETVIRTVKMGHPFTQGTTDSNEVWLDVTLYAGDRVIGRSGGFGPHNSVDPWSHFVNVYMLDRHGNRIDRRNAEDIFVPLYSHQIPPGAADVVHYRFTLPQGLTEPVRVEVALKYRKFDTIYMHHVYGKEFVNDLPVMVLATDSVTFPVAGGAAAPEPKESAIEPWQRWNDFGIGLFRKGADTMTKGELVSAELAFGEVERLGRPEGPLNRARVYLREGRLDEAVDALELAAAKGAYPWSVAYFTGHVNMQNVNLDAAIENFRAVVSNAFPEVTERGFDFSQDYTLRSDLGRALFERAKMAKGDARAAERADYLRQAAAEFERAIALDPENVTAHYNLSLIYDQLGDPERAARHGELHRKYKPDDNARDRAIATHRAENPAADHAAETIVIYDLARPGAYELPAAPVGTR